jgi:hypothetical protein
MSTAQAAQALGVDSRTVRRWITEGLRTPGGAVLRLQARAVKNGREYQVYQSDLEDFKAARDRAATEGQAAGQLARSEENQSVALTTSIQIIAAELERKSKALEDAQQTIERLAREAGVQAGRSEELERELAAARQQLAEREKQAQDVAILRQRVTELEQERERWHQQRPPRRIRLLPWLQMPPQQD